MLLALFLVSCDRTQHSQESTVKAIHVNPKDDVLVLSQFVDKINYLKLEAVAGHMVGNIDKLIYYQNRFYALDSRAAKSLFIFSQEGEFLKEIISRGQGPEEFTIPDDFSIDRFTGTIRILDLSLRKILTYDKDGNFLHEFGIDFRAHSFAIIDTATFAFFTNFLSNPGDKESQSYNLLIVKDNKLSGKYLPFTYRPNQLRFAPQTVFSMDSNEVYFTTTFNDTIFRFSSNKLRPDLLIDFGDRRIPEEFLNDTDKPRDQLHKERINYCHLINHFMKTDTHIYFTFSYKQRLHNVFYSKSSQRVLTSALIGNDIDGLLFANPIASMENRLIGVLEPLDLLEQYEKRPDMLTEEAIEIVESIDELSNPILVFYTLKF